MYSRQHNCFCIDVFLFSGIENPKMIGEPPKTFSFDYSYWSHTNVSDTGIFSL